MASTDFTDGVTPIPAAWLDTINDSIYNALGITDGAVPASRAALIYSLINALTADATPDLAADYVTTLDASATTGKKVLLNKLTEFKVGTFTRDITTASGTQAVTGVGFKPRLLLFAAGFATPVAAMSIGVDAGSNNAWCLYNYHNVSADKFGIAGSTYSIGIYGTNPDAYQGIVSTLDSDGFTVSWTKTGSPTGTTVVGYLAIK